MRTSRAAVLLDCGLFQGRRKETFENNSNFPVHAEGLDAVVLSHAHIDHSGALPVLCSSGFRGPIYATSATRDLCAPMLPDAAMVQEADARQIARLIVKLTDVFRVHPECYDQEARALLSESDSPFEFEGLFHISAVEDSKAIDAEEGPSIVIAGSGMCEGGRVLHHLTSIIGDSRNTIVIVGFQAQHTLGRRLVERRPEVRIFGLLHERRAEVAVLNGFSAHADRQELVAFAEAVRQRGPLRRVMLVHGEPPAQKALAAELAQRGFPTVQAPGPGERLRL